MKKLCYLIKITFQTKFAYIKAFWFNIFGTAVSILIYYFLWKYVFQSRNELHGFTAAQITTYVILSRLLSSQFSGGINREFAEWVQRGDIVVELLRPVPLVFTLFGKRVGEFLFFFLFKGIPVTILASLILGGIGPDSAANLILFFTSVLISIGLMFWIEIMVGLVSFFTLSSYGLGYTKTALMSILSGGIRSAFFVPGRGGESIRLYAVCRDGFSAGSDLSWKIYSDGGVFFSGTSDRVGDSSWNRGDGILPLCNEKSRGTGRLMV